MLIECLDKPFLQPNQSNYDSKSIRCHSHRLLCKHSLCVHESFTEHLGSDFYRHLDKTTLLQFLSQGVGFWAVPECQDSFSSE